MKRARRRAGAVLGGLAAGALTIAVLRLGWLLQWPRALLAGLLVATAVTALWLVARAQDLVGPGSWPEPPEPERVAGWPQLALVAGALRKTEGPGRRRYSAEGGNSADGGDSADAANPAGGTRGTLRRDGPGGNDDG
jgi:hypothetical protein